MTLGVLSGTPRVFCYLLRRDAVRRNGMLGFIWSRTQHDRLRHWHHKKYPSRI